MLNPLAILRELLAPGYCDVDNLKRQDAVWETFFSGRRGNRMGAVLGIVAAAILLLCLLFAGGCSRTPSNPPAATPANSGSGAPNKPAGNPPDAPPKKTETDRPINAMCYEIAPKTSRLDYTCPKCGERTLYETGETVDNGSAKTAARQLPKNSVGNALQTPSPPAPLPQAGEGSNSSAVAKMVESEIANCRREVWQLRKAVGDAVSLDESQFCRKCSPHVTSPKLLLRIAAADGQQREIELSSADDVRNAKVTRVRET
jgi:predicted RNA-binding Zn-ribbon protein involved in translation (DUF1610 family)